MPAHGHYTSNLLPAFLLTGLGLALCFVSVTIAGLSGVAPADAGVASGLVNTSRQVGGAIGLAVVSTIAVSSSRELPGSLTHGFHLGFIVLTGLALAGAVLAAGFLVQRPSGPVRVPAVAEEYPAAVEEAA